MDFARGSRASYRKDLLANAQKWAGGAPIKAHAVSRSPVSVRGGSDGGIGGCRGTKRYLWPASVRQVEVRIQDI